MLFVRDALAPAHCVLRVCQNWAAKIGHRLARIRGQRHVGEPEQEKDTRAARTHDNDFSCMHAIVSHTSCVAGVKVADHSGVHSYFFLGGGVRRRVESSGNAEREYRLCVRP